MWRGSRDTAEKGFDGRNHGRNTPPGFGYTAPPRDDNDDNP